MPRLTKSLPSYRKHSSGQARVSINGRDYLLGPHGTKASKREYDRIISEYLASGRSPSFGVQSDAYTMAMVMADYLRFAKVYFGGQKSSELANIKAAIAHVKKTYAALPAIEFSPSHFKVVRESMITGGQARTTINANMKRVTRMMKWAAAEGKLPASVCETLRLIASLKRGRTPAREPEPVKPVPVPVVNATLPKLPPIVADMVRLQLLLGCRPGEVCKLTPAMIDRSEKVWVAKLGEHKTAHHGHERNIYFGPQSQVIIMPYLIRGTDDCLFRPMDVDRQRREALTAKRVTPKSCGNRQGTNRKAKPKRKPGERYTTESYSRAIRRAAKSAGTQHWSPNQLRHSRGTDVRKQFGLEAAQVILGHASADITQTYAERDADLARKVAMKIG